RSRRSALRHRTPTARRARFLRQIPGSHSLRQGLVPAGGVPVLLARVRDERRLFRLLSAVPRLLEVVRHRLAGLCAEEGLLPECTEDHSRIAANRLAPIGNAHETPPRESRAPRAPESVSTVRRTHVPQHASRIARLQARRATANDARAARR